MEFYKKSYDVQSKTYNVEDLHNHEVELYKSWFDGSSVDLWRHRRMFHVLDPFLTTDLNAEWLTVGDGRFGTAAIYINRRGGQALATDLDETLLLKAKELGMIDHYQRENAECLSFKDNSFDYSFCKEAFHHFPRPFIALYEMIRCTRKAIIFTEPKEWQPAPVIRYILVAAKNKFKSIFGFSRIHPDFGSYETVGNYIYCISKREFEKVALGLNFPCVAYREFHDVYLDGVEKERVEDNGPLYMMIKKKIFINKIMTSIGLSGMNRISYILFKEAPSDELRDKLIQGGFKIIDLPRNPFI